MDQSSADLPVTRLPMISTLAMTTRDASVTSSELVRLTAHNQVKTPLSQSPFLPSLTMLMMKRMKRMKRKMRRKRKRRIPPLLQLQSPAGMSFKRSKIILTIQTDILALFTRSTAKWISSKQSFSRSSR